MLQGHGALPILHTAAANNQCKKVHNLIQTGIYIESKANDGSTALHIAASYGHLAMVALLIQLKANINALKSQKLTPLHSALQLKHFDVCELLIKSGADVQIKDNNDRTPLLYTANFGCSIKLVKDLISNGADVHEKLHDGRNSLHIVAQSSLSNRLDLVNCLIENGANLDAVDNLNYTALHNAAISGNYDIAKSLLDKGATIDARTLKRTTPLHFAIDTCHFNVAKLLLERGANVNAIDQTSWTPLHFAASVNGTDIASTLIKLGADINAKENQCIGTPLHLAVRYGYLNTVKVLVSNRAKVNEKMLDDFTPLHVGAQNGSVNIVKYLLENGSYFDMKSGHITNIDALKFAQQLNNHEVAALLKNTHAFFSAVKNNNISGVKKYLKHGVSVNCKSIQYKSALIYACWKGNIDVVNVLLAEGGNVNITDDNNMSALHYAARYAHLTIVHTLFKHGAVFNVISNNGKKTPLDYAIEGNNPNIIQLLQLLQRVFEDVLNGKLEVLQELAEIKMKKPLEFVAICNVRNREKKSLLEVGFASRSKEIAHSLLKMLN